PAADVGPPIQSGFSGYIRPSAKYLNDADHLVSLAPTLLNSTNIPSFDEADFSDKAAELQTNLARLSAMDQQYLYRQFGMRLGALLSLDDLIGSIFDALERNHMLDHTYVIFTSDNGWFYGQHRLSGKLLEYEDSAAIRLYVVAPSGTTQLCPKLA